MSNKKSDVYNAVVLEGCVLTKDEVERLTAMCAPYSLSKVIEVLCKSLLSGDLKISVNGATS